MTPQQALAALEVLRVGGTELRLARAWPRDGGHLLGEWTSSSGARVAGQWFADGAELARVGERTRAVAPDSSDVTVLTDEGVLLQARGADRRLPELAALVARPGATLLVHRPERRAVVRLDDGPAAVYAKVVRPNAARAIAQCGEAAAAALGLPTPRLLGVEGGVTLWSALPGVPLGELLDGEGATARLREVGVAVRGVHESTPRVAAANHDAAAEVAVIDTWLRRTRQYDPALVDGLAGERDAIAAALLGGTGPVALVHRDLHEGQLLLAGGRVGLLDFDLLAAGEAALDVANLLVHLELRALQGRCSGDHAAELGEAFLAGYDPTAPVGARLDAYAAAARLRLCLVYRFRPAWRQCVTALCERVRTPDRRRHGPGGRLRALSGKAHGELMQSGQAMGV